MKFSPHSREIALLGRLTIRARLIGIAALFLIPIALQVYLFVDQSRKDITFADKEVTGIAYLRAAWPAMHALTTAVNDPAFRPSGRLSGAPALDAIAKALDGEMGSAAASRDFAKTLGPLGWPNQAIAPSDKAEAAITAARALINKIGDASNLILDPDLDSYYVMDVALLRLPEAIDQARVLMTLAATYKAQAALNDDEKAQILIRAGQFAAAVDGAASSLDSAYKGNGDGKTKPALEPKLHRLGTLARGVSDNLQQLGSAPKSEQRTLANELQRAADQSNRIAQSLK